MREFPSEHIAEGWYQIGWSSDFPIGEAKPLQYFNEDLVAYRGDSGELHVLDAYCRHMGAHLGHGGWVEADCIRCPYHGWVWDADGRNIEIPYSKPDNMGNLRLTRWPVRELDGIALAYYSRDGAGRKFPLADAFIRFDGETWDACPETTKIWLDVPMAPQFMAENAVDSAHFKYVHRANDIGDIAEFTAEPGVFRGRVDLIFGGGMERTWATPNGPAPGHIFTENWGVGLGWSRLTAFDDIIYLLGITPITPYRADLRSTTWVARKRGDGSEMDEKTRNRWVEQQNAQVDADLRIWRTQTYIHKAPLARTENDCMRAMRKWAKNLYDEEVGNTV